MIYYNRFPGLLVTNLKVLSTKNWYFTLKFSKTWNTSKIPLLELIFANLKSKRQFLINRTPKFVISDLKKPHGPNLGSLSSNTSKVLLFRGNFCKFKGVTLISSGKFAEIRDHRPQKTYSKSSRLPVTKHPKSHFDCGV